MKTIPQQYSILNTTLSSIDADIANSLTQSIAENAYSQWIAQRDVLDYKDPRTVFLLESSVFYLTKLFLSKLFHECGLKHDFDLNHDPLAWYQPKTRIAKELRAKISSLSLKKIDFDVLGKLYESRLPAIERKKYALYTTPETIVDYILKSIGYNKKNQIEKYPILDISCGPATFLIRANEILRQRCQSLRLSKAKTLEVIQNNIIGYDINPFLVFLSKINILCQNLDLLAHTMLKPHEFLNSLNFTALDSLETIASQFCDYATNLLAEINHQKPQIPQVSYIVGNPPYGKARNLTQLKQEYYQKTMYGHPNYYGLFLQAGIDLLAPGGKLSYIMPSSMLSGLYFKGLRRYIVEQTVMREIVEITARKNVFDDVQHGLMIITLQKQNSLPKSNRSIRVASIKYPQQLNQEISEAKIDACKAVLKRNGSLYFIFSSQPINYDIINKFFQVKTALDNPKIGYKAKTGQIVWNRLKDHLHGEQDKDSVPLIWANNVSRYLFQYNNRNAGRNWLKLSFNTSHILNRQPSLLVQRTTAKEQPRRIVATYPQEFYQNYSTYSVENHLNYIVKINPNSQVEILLILGLLNSKLYDYIFRIVNGNTQVSATELNMLPIPFDIEESKQTRIISLVSKMLSTPNRQIDEELDYLIFEIYNLSNPEIATIQNFYKAYESKT